MRSSTWWLLLLVVGCARGPASGIGLADQRQARKNLKAQAEEVGRAAVEEHHARLADLTHPALVEKFGGRELYVKKLESIAAEAKRGGFRLAKVTVGEPSPLVEAAGSLYAVVPTEGELSGPGGDVGRQPSCLIAVSSDGGAGWKFIDGAGIGSHRGRLKKLLPDFPERLDLPAAQPPVWEKK